MNDGNNQTRRVFIDYLRVLCCAGVIFYHFFVEAIEHGVYTPRLFSPHLSLFQFSFPTFCVGIFFVISGFLLMESAKKKFSVGRFYLGRIVKILIPFYVVYLLAALFRMYLTGGIGQWGSVGPMDVLAFLFGADGLLLSITGTIGAKTYFGIGEWFLGALIVCYLLFPLLFRLAKRFPKSFAVSVGIAFLLFLCLTGSDVLSYRTITGFFFFLAGILLSCFFESLKRLRFYWWILLFLLAFLPFSLPAAATEIAFFLSVLSCFFLFAKAEPFFKKQTGLSARVADLSRLTYVAFLLQHFLILLVIDRMQTLHASTPLQFVAFFAITVVCILVLSLVLTRFLSWLTKKRTAGTAP